MPDDFGSIGVFRPRWSKKGAGTAGSAWSPDLVACSPEDLAMDRSGRWRPHGL